MVSMGKKSLRMLNKEPSTSSIATNSKTLTKADYSTPVLRGKKDKQKGQHSPNKLSVISKPKQKQKRDKEENKSQARERYTKQVLERHQNRKELVGRNSSHTKKPNESPQVSLKKISPQKDSMGENQNKRDSIHTFMKGDIELDQQYNSQIKNLNGRSSRKSPLMRKLHSEENSHSQPPVRSQGMNVFTTKEGQQNQLISIIKSHTDNINSSLSPRRKTLSPACSQKSMMGGRFERSNPRPNGIKATIDASKFFSRAKTEEKSSYNSASASRTEFEFNSRNQSLNVEQKVAEIQMSQNEAHKNKQLLEFIQVVKTKFSELESELAKTKSELVYYQRKSKDQAEVIENLRKRESYTTLKYGMLINQNHELSIKLKKKTETIAQLSTLVKQENEGQKGLEGEPSGYQNEEESYESDYK
mmetsp:Transcript_9057/g.8619  ORF Transcript_9057/g.8619 Transcript_9057/m.8619 type:complete len:416 (+) Transcript_9057:236-1483(+)